MKIALIAPPFLEIPPKARGGSEAIVSALAEELVRRDHQVTLFACGDSQTSGTYEQVFPQAINDMAVDTSKVEVSRKLRLEITYFSEVATRLSDRAPYDVVLNHTRGEVAFAPFTRYYPAPVVTTFHNIILPEQIEVIRNNPRLFTVGISQDHAALIKNLPNFVGVAYNGVNLTKFTFGDTPDDYLFWMGQIGERKNPLDAIAAARQADRKIIIAGKATDSAYFEKVIAPELEDGKVEYVGEATMAEKIKLYQKAAGFLFPTSWAEPFGLVMIEAMACGTPVIAYPNGAVPEVIQDAVTGFIVDDADQMATAIGKLDQIDRSACRRHVETTFSSEATTDQHLKAIETARQKFKKLG